MKTIYTIIYLGIIGVSANIFAEFLPRKWFNANKFPFKEMPWELHGTFYERWKIQKWKGRLPDVSKKSSFMIPKKIHFGMNSSHLETLIKETCVAEIVHAILCILALGILRIWQSTLGAYIWIAYLLGNLPFIMVQRYNRPHLNDLRNKMKLREEQDIK